MSDLQQVLLRAQAITQGLDIRGVDVLGGIELPDLPLQLRNVQLLNLFLGQAVHGVLLFQGARLLADFFGGLLRSFEHRVSRRCVQLRIRPFGIVIDELALLLDSLRTNFQLLPVSSRPFLGTQQAQFGLDGVFLVFQVLQAKISFAANDVVVGQQVLLSQTVDLLETFCCLPCFGAVRLAYGFNAGSETFIFGTIDTCGFPFGGEGFFELCDFSFLLDRTRH
ncbi:hypothetical protein D3C87_1159010 [compost metagenome]